MLDPDHLLKVAIAYRDATGLSFSAIGRKFAGPGNDKAFRRLLAGHGITIKTAINAENVFRENWPENATWPPCVPGKPRKTVPPVINRRIKRVSPAE